jgi:glycosyltransferase involved in cell wall biosynthesis
MDKNLQRRAADCDVMLLLEGTFPFVAGGVSSWVNQVLRAFPEIRFGICFLGSRRSDYAGARYALPDNVVHFEDHYLHEHETGEGRPKKMRGDAAAFASVERAHQALRAAPRHGAAEETGNGPAAAIAELMPLLAPGQALDQSAFLRSQQAWDYVTRQYRAHCTDPSFVDYFWTVRIMHAPIWLLAKIARGLIPARCYHTVSTGYAGFLGAMLKLQSGRPLLLSEHGIYTKERKIDLFQSEWIADNRGVFDKDASQLSYFRDLWIRFFEALGATCYDAADRIVALYEANRQRQVRDGAQAGRTRVIPNGIDLPRLAALRAQRAPASSPPPVLCLIGRVVPIKDVKTFIRAMRSVVGMMPEAEGWIAGPADEDPAYAEECLALAESLGLKDKVRFLGFQKIDALLPQIGLVVLSSISEALPLVLLEGYAAGVPAVATDVGCCRDLVLGGAEDGDRALGAAGAIVGIAEPQALAEAAVGLLRDGERWRAAQQAGIARVERWYTQERMFSEYRELYARLLAAPDAAAAEAAPMQCRRPR